ncbi:MAG TPA: YicC/YloC family endoribonuclease [Desulfomonilia bacterium]|nr:YicC/YloC family endoribonuclease [Desulfomonilia bacterium]
MPSSMTGFGQAEAHGYHVEIKGVNHRYKDIRVKVPRDLGALETAVRDMVSEAVHRGKVDVTVSRVTAAETQEKMAVNWDLARAYYEELCTMAGNFGGEVSFRDILLIPGVLNEGTAQREDQLPLVREVLGVAIDSFSRARDNEGRTLAGDIRARVGALTGMAAAMKDLATDMTRVYKDRLHANLSALLADKASLIDEVRLEQEVALLADKSDITEELVRLNSHLRLLEETITGRSGPIGRQTDFILQEINREINTIGSKSQINALSRLVIDAKTELEKVREQIQNIE